MLAGDWAALEASAWKQMRAEVDCSSDDDCTLGGTTGCEPCPRCTASWEAVRHDIAQCIHAACSRAKEAAERRRAPPILCSPCREPQQVETSALLEIPPKAVCIAGNCKLR